MPPFAATSRLATAVCGAALACCVAPPPCAALETVTFFQSDGVKRTLVGRSLAGDPTGGVLLQTDDGRLWLIEGDAVLASETDDRPFVAATFDAMQDRLREELPAGFDVYRTPHYLVAYDTSRNYAKWAASMLERLHRAFVSYWRRQGFELHEPEFPLVVTVYASEQAYRRASAEELGGARGVVGYYSLKTNRVSMYDLTGSEQARGGGGRRGSLREINRMLATPAASPLVATVVHEATHQIAFNCGLQQRYADLPLWLVEGMAAYFEAPDLSSPRGWRGIGKVNHHRLQGFRQNRAAWSPAFLAATVGDSRRFRDPRTAADAYADAWALNYYLIEHRPEQYRAFLKTLAEKPPLVESTRDERLEEFRQHFGDLSTLQADFLRRMSRLK